MPRNAPPPDADALIRALPASLQALAAQGALRHYRKGALLVEEGSAGDSIYVLLAGRIRAFSCDLRGREITYGEYGPGDYVGEMSLDGGPRSASVEALVPSLCALVTRQTLLAHIASEPGFALELLAKVIRRARAATLSARQMALEDAYGRLKALLEAAAEPQADGTRLVRERMTHREIAARLGCSREMVSRLLKDLMEGGYVATAGDGLRLLQPLPARW